MFCRGGMHAILDTSFTRCFLLQKCHFYPVVKKSVFDAAQCGFEHRTRRADFAQNVSFLGMQIAK